MGTKSHGSVTQFSMRLPTRLVREVDRMASTVSLSRTKFIERLLGSMVEASELIEGGGLFKEVMKDFEGQMERAVREAAQEMARAGTIGSVVSPRSRRKKRGAQ